MCYFYQKRRGEKGKSNVVIYANMHTGVRAAKELLTCGPNKPALLENRQKPNSVVVRPLHHHIWHQPDGSLPQTRNGTQQTSSAVYGKTPPLRYLEETISTYGWNLGCFSCVWTRNLIQATPGWKPVKRLKDLRLREMFTFLQEKLKVTAKSEMERIW